MKFYNFKFLILISFMTLLTASCLQSEHSDSEQFGSYKIDPVHSSLMFRVSHLGVANVYGRFTKIEGTFDFHEDYSGTSKVEVKSEVSSLTTDHKKRDDHLKSPDFFNVKKYPAITFSSNEFTEISQGNYLVKGTLKLLDVTKEIEIKLVKTGSKMSDKGVYRIGFEGGVSLNRSEFGMEYGLENIGDMVEVLFSVEGIRAAQ